MQASDLSYLLAGCIAGGLLGLLWREVGTMTRQIHALERRAASKRGPK